MAVDTDILAIHHIFIWDQRRDVNEKLFEAVKGKACTTIHNLLELCGLFAIAGLASKVEEVEDKYLRGKEFVIVFSGYHGDWGEYVSSVTEYIKRGLSYGDAIIVEALEQSDIETFITWNRKHLDGKLNIKLVTPEEYLKLHAG